MIALLALWAAVFVAAGMFIEHTRSLWWHRDPMRRLADADRRRLEEQARQQDAERAFLMTEIHGDGSGW